MKTQRSYTDRVHTWGRIWSVSALLVLMLVPLSFSVYYNAFPNGGILMKALMSVIPIYWTTAIIETTTYTPLLGAGGTYLSFVTGNITNLKLPCGLNAMERAGVKSNSEEGEVITTIAIGASAITTTIIIAVGVLLFTPILPKLTAPDSVFKIAFDNVLPALFGALGASYFAKHWKISIFPILVGVVAYIFVPALPVGTMIFITIVASLGGALAMYKLKWIK